MLASLKPICLSDDELDNGVECNYTKKDTMPVPAASCFMMRENEKKID